MLRGEWACHAYGRVNPLGWLITHFFQPHASVEALRRLNPDLNARVLDVGCGMGHYLRDLKRLGFRRLTGVDPFIPRDLEYGGIRVHRKELSSLAGQFDVITLNYSFEHMDLPGRVLAELARLLAPSGTILVRIPVANSYAWQHYGVNWVNLDPPRHLFIHTPATMGRLCQDARLTISRTVYESTAGQFWGSEQYLKGITLTGERSYARSRWRSVFTRGEIRLFEQQAERLNREGRGDLACFYLQHTKVSTTPGA
jgi:SAM-dependent methyltransferase